MAVAKRLPRGSCRVSPAGHSLPPRPARSHERGLPGSLRPELARRSFPTAAPGSGSRARATGLAPPRARPPAPSPAAPILARRVRPRGSLRLSRSRRHLLAAAARPARRGRATGALRPELARRHRHPPRLVRLDEGGPQGSLRSELARRHRHPPRLSPLDEGGPQGSLRPELARRHRLPPRLSRLDEQGGSSPPSRSSYYLSFLAVTTVTAVTGQVRGTSAGARKP